jgi:hypothetical protein
MSDYRNMTLKQLAHEMNTWQRVADMEKGPCGPSRAAREEANRQLALAEAWYHRLEMLEDRG